MTVRCPAHEHALKPLPLGVRCVPQPATASPQANGLHYQRRGVAHTVLLFLFVTCLVPPFEASGADAVRAKLGKETAWTGEAVPLILTLYSPGPFSGTAAFDWPELPRTAFVSLGGPVVGSEEIDGESYITQQHEITVYTQCAGEIVIPPFRVRFSCKKTFTSDPEPVEATTSELRFQSKRPPGTESMGVVISATEMEIGQSWNPTPEAAKQIAAGDVIERTIHRTARGTSAMMLDPVTDLAPEGVRVHVGPESVQDNTARGESSAERTDQLKYIFEKAGEFTIPDLDFAWWDPDQEELRTETVAGWTVRVAPPTVAEQPPADVSPATPFAARHVIGGLLAVTFLAWLLWKPTYRIIAAWQAKRDQPESRAARQLHAACSADDPHAAYEALLSWFAAKRTVEGWNNVESFFATQPNQELYEQWQMLSRHLFADSPSTAAWDGAPLWVAFRDARDSRPERLPSRHASPLPALNPD